MITVAVSFTNFGPYHLARLRALAEHLGRSGSRLVAYETAGSEGIYPWKTSREDEPFRWVTLFPDRALEDLSRSECVQAMRRALDRDRPDALGVVGYARPESMAMLRWALAQRRPSVLMSETQEIDHPRVWWKEAVKRRRVRGFSAALVGGPKHRDYLVTLGMPADRIAFGYNAVDGSWFASQADHYRHDADGRLGLPERPFFLSVSRFVPEKNLVRLVQAFGRYRSEASDAEGWDLVLCGDGAGAGEVARAVAESGYESAIHRPGFLQNDALARYYAFASAFVHPSLMEPWGLVVNEAAACGLPLLVSDRCGCVETFVPEVGESTGLRLAGRDVEGMAASLHWMANLPDPERLAMGRRATAIAAEWGPERFARGTVEALQTAMLAKRLEGPLRPVAG
jgi:1,2-diacylglycerol 3-alpha-glucosyltransferase